MKTNWITDLHPHVPIFLDTASRVRRRTERTARCFARAERPAGLLVHSLQHTANKQIMASHVIRASLTTHLNRQTTVNTTHHVDKFWTLDRQEIDAGLIGDRLSQNRLKRCLHIDINNNQLSPRWNSHPNYCSAIYTGNRQATAYFGKKGFSTARGTN